MQHAYFSDFVGRLSNILQASLGLHINELIAKIFIKIPTDVSPENMHWYSLFCSTVKIVSGGPANVTKSASLFSSFFGIERNAHSISVSESVSWTVCNYCYFTILMSISSFLPPIDQHRCYANERLFCMISQYRASIIFCSDLSLCLVRLLQVCSAAMHCIDQFVARQLVDSRYAINRQLHAHTTSVSLYRFYC